MRPSLHMAVQAYLLSVCVMVLPSAAFSGTTFYFFFRSLSFFIFFRGFSTVYISEGIFLFFNRRIRSSGRGTNLQDRGRSVALSFSFNIKFFSCTSADTETFNPRLSSTLVAAWIQRLNSPKNLGSSSVLLWILHTFKLNLNLHVLAFTSRHQKWP